MQPCTLIFYLRTSQLGIPSRFFTFKLNKSKRLKNVNTRFIIDGNCLDIAWIAVHLFEWGRNFVSCARSREARSRFCRYAQSVVTLQRSAMEEQQQNETSTRPEVEDPCQEVGIWSSEEAISFMLNVGESFTVYVSVFYMFLVAGTEYAWEVGPPGADTSWANLVKKSSPT